MSYPGKYKITTRQGDTLDKTFTWEVESAPVNLSGFTADMQVRSSAESETVVLDAGNFITLGGTLNKTITAKYPDAPACPTVAYKTAMQKNAAQRFTPK